MSCRTRATHRILTATTIVAVLLVVGGCREIELYSTWTDAEPKINGRGRKWAGDKVYIDKHDLAIATGNDSTSLYLYLSTLDRQLKKQFLMGGVTVWLDDGAKTDSAYGLRFPAVQVRPRAHPGEWTPGSDVPNKEKLEELNRAIELLGPEEGRKRYLLVLQAKTLGLDAGLGVEPGEVAVEFSLPLAPTDENPHALNPDTSGIVCLRIQTTPPEMPSGAARTFGGRGGIGGGRPADGGMGGGGGRPGGGMRGGGGKSGGDGMGPPTPSMPLEMKLKIHLAKPWN